VTHVEEEEANRIIPSQPNQSNQIKDEETSAVLLTFVVEEDNPQQVSIPRQDDAEVEGIGGLDMDDDAADRIEEVQIELSF